MLCTRRDGKVPCGQPAVEILLVLGLSGSWQGYPRCARHPAEDDAHVLEDVIVGQHVILPVPPDVADAADEAEARTWTPRIVPGG
jgi:hypothetical protein